MPELTALALAAIAAASAPGETDLEADLAALDARLFEAGFNRCELDGLEEIISPDLEFYHDISGLSTTREAFMEALQRNICSAEGTLKPIRRLDAQSVEIHPLRDNGTLYGAIQTGTHRFYLGREPDAPLTSIARFSHVWLVEDGAWQLARVLSFDHCSPQEETCER